LIEIAVRASLQTAKQAAAQSRKIRVSSAGVGVRTKIARRMKMKRVDDFRLRFGKRELVPIMIGGMGVDISTTDLALEAARLGGIGHISDAMINTVADRRYQTKFVKDKLKQYKFNVENADKAVVKFDLGTVEEATRLHVRSAMDRKQGEGMIFINCMEKLTMNAPRETLKVRLSAALDAGIDGITLAAGLHLGSLALIEDHPRFRDAKIGIIVSSVRALQLFLKKNAKLNRLPDYVVVEGPLAGGHLGFGMDWAAYDLATINAEVIHFLREEKLDIPVIPAGGIFTGSDAVGFLESGSSAVQVATRFTVAKECGLPEKVQQDYFKANEDDIEVNQISPTGYPMRMLKSSPAIGSGIRPNCEAYGYLLDANGKCAYVTAYNREVELHPDARRVSVMDKTCLCTHMRNFDCWTCGHYTYRLKDTSHKRADGSYQILSAEHIFRDYQFSTDGKIALPEAEAA
jgi:nitronate monooxygenase